MDEVLMPADYATAGGIIDDDLRRMLVDPLPEGARLWVVVDACRSGSMLDLRYTYNNLSSRSRHLQENPRVPDTKADVFCISGCKDDQSSVDLGSRGGALTCALCRILEESAFAIDQKRMIDSLVKSVRMQGYEQIPQLCFGKSRNFTADYFLFQ
jgi:metacaspase-1